MGQSVGLCIVCPECAPVHGDEDSARSDRFCHFSRKARGATTRSHLHPTLILNPQVLSITGMNLNKGIGVHLHNLMDATRAGLGMPVTIKTPSCQDIGIVWIGRFCQTPRVISAKPRPSVRGMKTKICVETR